MICLVGSLGDKQGSGSEVLEVSELTSVRTPVYSRCSKVRPMLTCFIVLSSGDISEPGGCAPAQCRGR